MRLHVSCWRECISKKFSLRPYPAAPTYAQLLFGVEVHVDFEAYRLKLNLVVMCRARKF